MEIIENSTLHYSPIEYSHEEFRDGNYHIYFAYNISETVTGVSDLQVTVTAGPQPIEVTAEHCTHPEMVAQGNIYVIHVELEKYYYANGASCNRVVRVTGGWETEELPIDIPISTQVIQIGCPTLYTVSVRNGSYDGFGGSVYIDEPGVTEKELAYGDKYTVYGVVSDSNYKTIGEENTYFYRPPYGAYLLDTYSQEYTCTENKEHTIYFGKKIKLKIGRTASVVGGTTRTNTVGDEYNYKCFITWDGYDTGRNSANQAGKFDFDTLIIPYSNLLKISFSESDISEGFITTGATIIDQNGYNYYSGATGLPVLLQEDITSISRLVFDVYRVVNIKFANYDGTVLQDSYVDVYTTPSYTGSTPTKPSTAQYTYTFTGWSPGIDVATASTTYVAQFDEIPKTDVLFYAHPDEPIIDSKVPYELSGGASLGLLK